MNIEPIKELHAGLLDKAVKIDNVILHMKEEIARLEQLAGVMRAMASGGEPGTAPEFKLPLQGMPRTGTDMGGTSMRAPIGQIARNEGIAAIEKALTPAEDTKPGGVMPFNKPTG